ncbi:MAG: epoxyqueuosine reductase QueH [Bacilli bacterium]|nr:epoxyqueuosine reductase QueH [Bacilli bacterium]
MNNEYLEFKTLLESIKQSGKKPTLLLHSCCGPCSSYVLNMLKEYFKITIFYYNPNIYPHEEFIKRYNVQVDLIKKMNLNIDVIMIDEDYSVYLDAVKGYSDLKEGSMRCYRCYEFRIKKLSEYASMKGFDYYSTVMSVSPYKSSKWINELGIIYQDKALFLYSNYKKENGYKESIKLSKLYDLYRQDWCGCEFSLKEHEERINNKISE